MNNFLNEDVESLYDDVESLLEYNSLFTKKRAAMLTSLILLQEKKSDSISFTEISNYSKKNFSKNLKLSSFQNFVYEINEFETFDLIDVIQISNESQTKEIAFKCSKFLIETIKGEIDDDDDEYEDDLEIESLDDYHVPVSFSKGIIFSSFVLKLQDSLIDSSIKIDDNLKAFIDITKEISSKCDLTDFHPLITVYLCRIYEYLGIIKKDMIDFLHPLILERSEGVENIDQAHLCAKEYISWAWLLQRTKSRSKLKELLNRMKNFNIKKDTARELSAVLPFYTEMARILIKVDKKMALKIWKSKIPKFLESALKKQGIIFSHDSAINTDDSMLKEEGFAEIFINLGEYLAEFIISLIEEKQKKKEKVKIEEIVNKLLKPFYSIFAKYHLYMLPFGAGLSKLFLLDNGKLAEFSIAESYIRGMMNVENSQQGVETGSMISLIATIAYNYRMKEEIFKDTPELIEFLNNLPISGKITVMMAKSINEEDEYYKKLFNKFINPLLTLKNADPESNIITDETSLEEYDVETTIGTLLVNFSLLPSKPQAEYIYQAIKNLKPNIKKLQLLGTYFSVIAQNKDYDYFKSKLFEYVQKQLSINENYRNAEESDTPIIIELYRVIAIYYKVFLLACDNNYKEFQKKVELLNIANSIFNKERESPNYKDFKRKFMDSVYHDIQGKLSREILATIIKTLQMQHENIYLDHNDFI